MSTTTTKFVIYARVSTDEQGQSGLGIEAQLHACRQHIERAGGQVLREFVEVASGDDDTRPVAAAVIKLAKRTRAKLVVAKIDRLTRSVAFGSMLLREGVEVLAVECPNAGTLEHHIRLVIGEEERRKIGERTRDALAAAKRRGVLLGSARPDHWAGREDRRRAGAATASARAAAKRRQLRAEVYAEAMPVASRLRADGASLRAIADELNRAELLTPAGGNWHASQVARLLEAAA